MRQFLARESNHLKSVPGIDPGQEADIRHLLDLFHAAALATQAMAGAETSVRPLMVCSFRPGAYRDGLMEPFFAKFHSKLNGQALVNLLVPIYDKPLTDEEVKGPILFLRNSSRAEND
jgi:hypothetical protein